jgi:OFA family oxalate/formate antiporter-like MFS transporter
MSSAVSTGSSSVANRGWSVTLAGTGINLALGILYTWSVISKGVPEEWGWSQSDKAWPYAVACLVFSLIMVPAGRMQDKISPRFVATVGGLLVGLGMIVASQTSSALGYILGFGVLAGAGIGFAYASATPPSIKWFPSAKTGMIAGIVVSGFGLASLYAAPLSQWLIATRGLSQTVLILGIAFLVVVCGLAQILVSPPTGYVPAGQAPKPAAAPGEARMKEDYSPKEMLGTWQFWALWFMYACGAGAGLMIISVAKKIVAAEATEAIGVAAVMGLAVGNGAGRIIAGTVSDKLGRKLTLFLFLTCQAVLLGLLTQAQGSSPLASGSALIIITALVGANYGSNLALFPSVTKDYFGLKNFGMNYGLVFTAWGVGGFILAKIAGAVYDKTGSFNFAYILAAALLVTAAIVTFVVRQPHHKETA